MTFGNDVWLAQINFPLQLPMEPDSAPDRQGGPQTAADVVGH